MDGFLENLLIVQSRNPFCALIFRASQSSLDHDCASAGRSGRLNFLLQPDNFSGSVQGPLGSIGLHGCFRLGWSSL